MAAIDWRGVNRAIATTPAAPDESEEISGYLTVALLADLFGVLLRAGRQGRFEI